MVCYDMISLLYKKFRFDVMTSDMIQYDMTYYDI